MTPFHVELNWFRGPMENRCLQDGLLLVDCVSLVSWQASLQPWCHTWKREAILSCRSGGRIYYTPTFQLPDLRAMNSGTRSSKCLSLFSNTPIYKRHGGKKMTADPMLTLKRC